MEKKINYLSRDFESIKSELLKFSKKYYPEITNDFNDASVGAWLIDLVSAVGDDLSYHTDRMYQETNINSSNLKSSALNNARLNGVKIPGAKPSVCEVELSCSLPVHSEGNISSPNWKYAPLIKRGSVVGNSSYSFELSEDVNFKEQFNSDGFSNRKFKPERDSNGSITSYTVTKNVVVLGGKSKVYKKIMSEDEIKPFMEIILPEKNIMSVESIIFKESANLSSDPNTSEYFIDNEVFKTAQEDIYTYRYFEVDSLSDLYRFGTKTDSDNIEIYDDYGECVDVDKNNCLTKRYYKGEWKAVTQKFITEYTDNDYLKIIFGAATNLQSLPANSSTYTKYIMSNIINNNMLGILPKAGWTMYVLYRVGGGVETNVAQGAINSVINANIVFDESPELTSQNKSAIIKSLRVYNPTTAIGGKDAPSTEEIKYLTKYNVNAQQRCVTVKDYKAKVMQMPPKYGCPFRCNVVEDNNKISMSMLGMNAKGHLSTALPLTLIENVLEYLKNYKSLTDYVEIRSGKIFNIGVEMDVFIDKNYITHDVVSSIISLVDNYMKVSKHDMGNEIFIGDIEKEINSLDGVISIIDFRLYSISGGEYSKDVCPLPQLNETYACNTTVREPMKVDGDSSVFQIDINSTDRVLYNDYDSMYEIKFPQKDIKVRVKTR